MKFIAGASLSTKAEDVQNIRFRGFRIRSPAILRGASGNDEG